jgi:hypothetical protein
LSVVNESSLLIPVVLDPLTLLLSNAFTMLNTIAFLSLMATAVMAQNPLIPSGISESCKNFLTELNGDSSLQSCTQPLVAATEAYGPNGSGNKDLSSALSTLCSSNGCPDSMLRNKLTGFYSSCGPELTSNPNNDVRRTYDVLYALTPFKQAVCSKGDSGKNCVTEMPAPSGSDLSQYLAQKSDGPQVAMYPNATTYTTSNILFLFLKPDLASDKLCTPCSRSVLLPYVNLESNLPFAYSITESMLKGQSALYDAIQQKCGKDFMGGAVQAAGGLSGGLGSGSPRTVSMATESVLGVLAALAFGFVAVF